MFDCEEKQTPDEMDLDYARSAADRARAFMTLHEVPPTPDNFAVWFQYGLGTDEELCRTIDALIVDKRAFDKRVNWGLVQAVRKLQAQDAVVASTATERLNGVLEQAISFLAKAAAENRVHARELGDLASQAERGDDPMSIIGALAAELSRATARAAALETNLAATSSELARVRNSLKVARQRAQTDALTGLANRRALDDYVRSAQIRARKTGETLTVMMVDIDQFKRFNDTFGHQNGDHVLRLVSGVFRSNLRKDDFAARYGGEELVAVLPGLDLEAAVSLADRIRTAIGVRNIVRRSTGETLAKVTVSIGLATYGPGETTAELFDRCDRALYLAKESGRNCVRTEQQLAL